MWTNILPLKSLLSQRAIVSTKKPASLESMLTTKRYGQILSSNKPDSIIFWSTTQYVDNKWCNFANTLCIAGEFSCQHTRGNVVQCIIISNGFMVPGMMVNLWPWWKPATLKSFHGNTPWFVAASVVASISLTGWPQRHTWLNDLKAQFGTYCWEK